MGAWKRGLYPNRFRGACSCSRGFSDHVHEHDHGTGLNQCMALRFQRIWKISFQSFSYLGYSLVSSADSM